MPLSLVHHKLRFLLASGTHGREPGGKGGAEYHDLNPNPEILWGSQKACGSAVLEGGFLELSGSRNLNTDSKRIHVTVPSSWQRGIWEDCEFQALLALERKVKNLCHYSTQISGFKKSFLCRRSKLSTGLKSVISDRNTTVTSKTALETQESKYLISFL